MLTTVVPTPQTVISADFRYLMPDGTEFVKPSANMVRTAQRLGVDFPYDTVGNCLISSDDLLLCIIGKMDARIKALEQSEKTADMIADAMMQDRDEQVEKVGEQMDIVAALRTALEAVLNSDMAMREEDEGRESETLNLVRAALGREKD